MRKGAKQLITVLLWLCCGLPPLVASAQVQVICPDSETVEAYKALVRKTLIGNGVLTGHFEVTAPIGAVAAFTFKTDQNLVTEGLVLSTGHVNQIKGPNDTTNTSTEFFAKGDEDLSNLIGRLTADAVSIEFDFIPFSDSIGFYYFFASEEYPEYVGKGFNDAFAFLIKGPGYPYYTNIARIFVNGRSIPISIDNVNFIANSDQFITNHLPLDERLVKPKSWQKMLGEPQLLNDIEFDGMTKKMRAVAKVVPNEIYRLKIVIADVGDMRYDSGVFLEKESFGSPTNTVASTDTLALLQKFKHYYRNDSLKLSNLLKNHPVLNLMEKPKIAIDSFYYTIYFDSDSFATSAKNGNEVRKAIKMLGNLDDSSMQVSAYLKGFTDSTAAEGYNKKLSEKRVWSVAKMLKKQGITIKEASGMGEEMPAKPNRTPEGRRQNRRVEILLVREAKNKI